MRRALWSLLPLVLLLGSSSCATEFEAPPTGSIEQEVGGPSCTSTADCADGKRCTTEVGECRTPHYCGKGRHVCPDVCYGVCRVLDTCGPVTCAQGEVCCNDSCGICTLPDSSCIQIICEPEVILPG